MKYPRVANVDLELCLLIDAEVGRHGKVLESHWLLHDYVALLVATHDGSLDDGYRKLFTCVTLLLGRRNRWR